MKTYINLQDLFDDKIFTPTDLLIIWAKRGKGKSSFMGKLMSEFMKPDNARKRIEVSQYKCDKLKQADIFIDPPEDHIVFCDTFFEDNGFKGEGRRPYKTSGLNMALPNTKYTDIVPTIPAASIFLDEIQDLYDSHQGALQTFVSKYYELSRQIAIFIALACQRPMRVVKDLRELATFVEIADREDMYIRGKVISTVWTLNIIYENADLERYIETRDKTLINRTIKVLFRGDIYSCYDPDYYMPMFYKGFENQRFVFDKVERTEFSSAGFEKYAKQRLIDIPEAFRGKTEKKSNKKEKLTDDGTRGTRSGETENN